MEKRIQVKAVKKAKQESWLNEVYQSEGISEVLAAIKKEGKDNGEDNLKLEMIKWMWK